jgi:hypothetical protein
MQLVAIVLAVIALISLAMRKSLSGIMSYLANVVTVLTGVGAVLLLLLPALQTPSSNPSATALPTSSSNDQVLNTAVSPTQVVETPLPVPTATQQPITSIDFTVQATAQRSDTRLDVKKGQYVTVEYIGGSWRAGDPNRWALVGANGDPAVPHGQNLGFPIPDENLLMLIGGVGNSPPIAIGVRNEFQSNTDGVLWLGPNDDTPEDNIGSLTVRISIR